MISTAAVGHGDIKQRRGGIRQHSEETAREEQYVSREQIKNVDGADRSSACMEQALRDHGRAAMSVDERAETALREHGRDRRGTADENLDEMGAHVGVRR
jgi:hypothetical protein